MPVTKRSLHMKIALSLGCAMLLCLSACEPKKPRVPGTYASNPIKRVAVAKAPAKKAEAARKEKKPSFAYSPFVLRVPQGSPFKLVSFKDVGLKIESDDDAMMMYETIAEALSLELGANMGLKMSARVDYDESVTDPKNHLACGSDQLYVDLWRSEGPARWGFSLWSGCGEDDNFAWKEVVVETLDTGDPMTDVKSLTSNIVSTLAGASSKNCYQKTC